MITDSHCHLDYPELFNQLENIIKRAELNQVKKFLTICTTLKSFETIKIIVEKYNNVFGTFGIHPHESENHKDIDASYIINLKKQNKKVIGIGETGLDFYYNHSNKNSQKKSFIEHIKAAASLKVPVIVHSRNADIDTYEIIKNEKKKSEVDILMHCFTGSTDFAKKLVDLNCYISVSGIITFNKSAELAKTISSIPIENLLVETDSPYLAPCPMRGKPNEPSFIIHTIEKLAQIKKISKESTILNTTKNFHNLFHI